ncbi:helix-turn-helix transcriptional regulator [Pseudomonas kurunegalensis]|uniref:helix-turn-helix transcriptional regulator n=1 Tax=Pseudomonas kurunegalensis TaxID=485880 RepID=UPI0040296EDA
MIKDPDLRTPAEICRELEIYRSTFWRWRTIPGFPEPLKKNKMQMVFRLSEVKSFLTDQKIMDAAVDAYQANAAERVSGSGVQASLRDYFAVKAMQGICAHDDNWGCDIDGIAERSYAMADAMLAARVKP